MLKEIPLYGVVNLPEMEEAAVKILRSGRIAGGEYVGKFEAGLSNLLGQPHVVSTVDMTSALFLALHLSGVGEGDEVLTTAFACLSTNSAIAQLKANPVWIDVKPLSVEIDLVDVKSKITEKTKAVILYHVAGYPGPARELADLCKKQNIALIEDCDNALFAQRDSELVGTHGDFAIYSFYPTRQINTTEGGALICRSELMASKARKLRRFGIDFQTFRSAEGEINSLSDIPEIGWGVTLNNLCSALGCAQLDSAKSRHYKTQKNAQKLKSMTDAIQGIRAVPVIGDVSAYWVFLFFAEQRDDMLRELKRQGIMASAVHYRNDRYTGFGTPNSQQLLNTDYLQKHILAVPCGWWLEEQDIEYIASALKVSASIVSTNKSEYNA